MAALNLTAESFDKVISSGQLVLVDFWATWCRPCMMMGPVVEELSNEFDGRAIIAKINVDDEGVSDICARFGITNIPPCCASVAVGIGNCSIVNFNQRFVPTPEVHPSRQLNVS